MIISDISSAGSRTLVGRALTRLLFVNKLSNACHFLPPNVSLTQSQARVIEI